MTCEHLPKGIVPLLETPFDEEGRILFDDLGALVEDTIAGGVNGLTAPLVASEVHALTVGERDRIVSLAAEAIGGRVPFIVGASSDDVDTCRHFAEAAEKTGAAAYIVAVPNVLYGRVPELIAYYRSIVEAAGTPLIIQDLQWNGPGLDVDSMRRLRDALPVLAGLKIETVPAGPKYTQVREAFGADFYISGGWAVPQLIEALDRGVDAMIPETALVRAFAAVYQAHRRGDRAGAIAVFRELVPVLVFSNQELYHSIAFFKRLLHRKGLLSSAALRPPGYRWDSYNQRIWLLLAGVASLAPAQDRIDLAGQWERWVGDQLLDIVSVPSSYRPVGTAVLRRTFELAGVAQNRRVLIRFEGVAHHGVVRVNGAEAGTMGPWTPFDFDITQNVRAGKNQLDVEITDWQVPLGPIGAWEASGGIIRAVAIETRPDPYIANAQLRYRLSPSLDAAHCSLAVYMKAAGATAARVRAELVRDGNIISSTSRQINLTAGDNTVALEWDLKAPLLWSPDNPALYRLRVTASTSSGEDVFADDTGFRSLEIRGDKFYLNGNQLVLRGVCRHDIWKDQGHTMTDEQIAQDLSMIKSMGANFIRLVHYPHDRRVVRAANRVGLLVTEESGLVWLDFRKISRETLDTGIGNLERTIRRDWNSPALFAVLLANESAPTLEAIQEGRRRVRAIAPDLFMSSARIDGPDRDFASSKRLFDEGGLDFYTDHKYGYDMRMFEEASREYSGKPLVFTEWGGRAIGQSPVLMRETTERIGRLVEQGRLAGYSFWSWADLPEFSRQDEEMDGGILKSGVVTEDRTPRADVFLALASLYRRVPLAKPRPEIQKISVLPPRTIPLTIESGFTPVPLQKVLDDPGQAAAWTELESLMERFWKYQGFTANHWAATGRHFSLWDRPKLMIGPIPFATAVRDGATRPLVLSPQHNRIEIPVGLRASRLHFLGNVTLPDGYPVLGRLGDRAARYTIEYEGGERQEVPLRWGYELARSNTISVATRIDPAAVRSERVLLYAKDPVREVHQTRLFTVPTKDRIITRIVCELDSTGAGGLAPPAEMHHGTGDKPGAAEQALILFAVTAEQAR